MEANALCFRCLGTKIEKDSLGLAITCTICKGKGLIPMNLNRHPSWCDWCGKEYYNADQVEGRGYSWAMFCSDECFLKHARYGKYKDGLIQLRYYLLKPYFFVKDFLYSEVYCPKCHKQMLQLLSGWLYSCETEGCEYEFATAELNTKTYHIHHALLLKSIRTAKTVWHKIREVPNGQP